VETFPTLAGAKAVADPAKRLRRAAVFMVMIQREVVFQTNEFEIVYL
jgi:hypothetical protein